ncbi:Retrovirus-related Pol polyprotein from transposon TNT 1-94 [Vitis vinifera]|uniref:Retrovirus-related Pol polyprotein from transposon TNT 1-94 n=1 Tax=Vitis vinifera TaxID=29760 RepID=A0A438HRV5_VITVI|nr:Retrovirus-related Pol polyprotein from transposon TNT 1-94 [Vitis vinifera]
MAMRILDWALRVDKPSKFEFFHIVAQTPSLRTAAYILNQVPSKSVLKTPYELCATEAWLGPITHSQRNLILKTISGFFVGYCIGSRGSRFYCPSHTTRIIELDRVVYFEDDIEEVQYAHCKSTKAPIVKGDKFSKAQCPQNDDEREEMKTIPYSSVVGSLMYAQVCTRPDIAFVVGMLGRYLSNPGSQHWKAAKKVLSWVCDADFAGCIDDKKSTTGYIFMMAGGAVSWKSVKQTLTASSTMEAEYVTCYEACCHAMWMRNFISALGVVDSISRPLKLFCDNSAAVAFSKNTRSISRSKHIDVKFYFVKEKVAESLIDIEHMSTKSMLADPLTKGLPIIAFQEHVSQMGLLEA